MKLFFGHRDISYDYKFDFSGKIWRFCTNLTKQIGYKSITPNLEYKKL